MRERYLPFLIASIAILVLTGCLRDSPASRATPNLSPLQFTPVVGATPTSLPTLSARPSAPSWWPPDLTLPNGAVMLTDQGAAVWKTTDLNASGLRDHFTRQGRENGYMVYEIVESEGSIYDLLFVRDSTTTTLNITQGSDSTILTGDRTGTMQIKVTGSTNLNLTLPLRTRLDLSPGSEVSIGTSVPNQGCGECQYFINVHIAPFRGTGNYASQPAGPYIIDVELIPGGTPENDDFRWAKSCTVQVRNQERGEFECKGLENITDNTKVVDVSGSWQQPVR